MFSIILVLLIAAQPMPAGFCDMQSSGDAPQPAKMQHAGMPHAGMQHAGMQHDPTADGASHDCCAAARRASFQEFALGGR
jgi:hypothetical protein